MLLLARVSLSESIILDDLFCYNFQVEVNGKVGKGQQVCTLDETVDYHGHPAIRERSGNWVAGILLLGNFLYYSYHKYIYLY